MASDFRKLASRVVPDPMKYVRLLAGVVALNIASLCASSRFHFGGVG